MTSPPPRQTSSTLKVALLPSGLTSASWPTKTTSALATDSGVRPHAARAGVAIVIAATNVSVRTAVRRMAFTPIIDPLVVRVGRCRVSAPSIISPPPMARRNPMARVIRAALLQADWTGDKESMIAKHEKYAREAAEQGAQVMCFQELFYGPYFCQVQDPQYFAYTEKIPGGPTTERMQALAKETGMVLVVPMYEEDPDTTGIYYNTAAVIDADGTYLGKYRKTHIPHVKGFWEKFYFRPGNMGYPVFDTAVGKVGVYICYDRHFPEGARALGLNGAELVFIPSATSRGLSEYLWRVEQVSHALANGYFVGTINRVGIEPLGEDDFYGQSYFVDPRGQFVGDVGDAHKEELLVRDLDMDKITEVRQLWQFYRDRRPDAYQDLVRP
jgi:N-carbamoylputrescine amidase